LQGLDGDVTLRRRQPPLRVQLSALFVASAEERPALMLVDHALPQLAHVRRKLPGRGRLLHLTSPLLQVLLHVAVDVVHVDPVLDLEQLVPRLAQRGLGEGQG